MKTFLRYTCTEGCGIWEVDPNFIHAVEETLRQVRSHRRPGTTDEEHVVTFTTVRRKSLL